MRKKSMFVLLALALIIVPSVSATRPHYIYDNANVVDTRFEGYINTYGGLLDSATMAEIVIVTLQTLPSGKTIEETKLYYYNDVPLDGVKGIGKAGKDNGVLILLVIDSHDAAIETGYGVEGQLTDAECGRIIMDVMVPQFKDGKFGDGLYYGMKAVGVELGFDASITIGTTTTVDVPVATPTPPPDLTPYVPFVTAIFFVSIVAVALFLFVKKRKDDAERERLALERIEEEKRERIRRAEQERLDKIRMAEEAERQKKAKEADEARRRITFFCPHCKQDRIGRKNDPESNEHTDNGMIYLLTFGSILCLTCNTATRTLDRSEKIETVVVRVQRLEQERAVREKREAEERLLEAERQRRRRQEEEERERRHREEEERRRRDSYNNHTQHGSGSSGSFGGGHSGGGGARGKW